MPPSPRPPGASIGGPPAPRLRRGSERGGALRGGRHRERGSQQQTVPARQRRLRRCAERTARESDDEDSGGEANPSPQRGGAPLGLAPRDSSPSPSPSPAPRRPRFLRGRVRARRRQPDLEDSPALDTSSGLVDSPPPQGRRTARGSASPSPPPSPPPTSPPRVSPPRMCADTPESATRRLEARRAAGALIGRGADLKRGTGTGQSRSDPPPPGCSPPSGPNPLMTTAPSSAVCSPPPSPPPSPPGPVLGQDFSVWRRGGVAPFSALPSSRPGPAARFRAAGSSLVSSRAPGERSHVGRRPHGRLAAAAPRTRAAPASRPGVGNARAGANSDHTGVNASAFDSGWITRFAYKG